MSPGQIYNLQSTMTSSTLTFSVAMTEVCTSIKDAGFSTDLWEPEFGWRTDEKRRDGDKEASASDDPYPLQKLAAYQIFDHMFCKKTSWVHLAAEMQAGKTGVMNALFRIILSNTHILTIDPTRIFTTTGMSDDDWQTQTARRVPNILRENVHHSGTLAKVAAKLASLAQSEDDGRLRNILIVLDESHHAAASRNRPNMHVYNAVERHCPRDLWAERGIRFLTVSATDPAKVIAMQGSNVPTAVVRLQTSDAYQSVQSLRAARRLLAVTAVLHTPAGADILCNKVRELETVHGSLIHILRPNMAKNKDMNAIVEVLLKERIPGCVVVPWDTESKKRRAKEAVETASVVSTDINEAYLSEKPTQTTFILLKGMFRAAKTLDDAHVGVLYDRVGAADSTNLQSLLGRACGYGKSTRTVVFAAESTVNTYIQLWRELCSNRNFPTVTDVPVESLRGKMPGVTTKKNRGVVRLVLKPAAASPLGSAAGGVAPPVVAARQRRVYNEDDFDVTWSAEFHTADEAMAITHSKKMKALPNGFYSNAASGNGGPMTREQLVAVQNGKKTANGRPSARPCTHKTFAFYENPLDASTVRFVVRTLTRKV